MTVLINASNSSGLTITSDTSGNVAIQSNGSNAIVTAGSNVTVAGTLTATGGIIQGASAAPAFSVYVNSAQNIPSGTETTVQFDTKTFDTANVYSTSTYRVTPTVAGYYQFNFTVSYNNNAVGTEVATLYKNGSQYVQLWSWVATSNYYNQSGSILVYANGTTDYFYITLYQSQGSNRPLTTQTIWSGFLARNA